MTATKIINGISLDAAAQETGVDIYKVLVLIKRGEIFGNTDASGTWFISPDALPVIRRYASGNKIIEGVMV